MLSDKTPQEKYEQEIVNILEKVNETVLPKKSTQRDKWISQPTEPLVKDRVNLRSKYKNHRNQEKF